jgi:hypothetical protein
MKIVTFMRIAKRNGSMMIIIVSFKHARCAKRELPLLQNFGSPVS